ncbi:SpoIIE family protein phosphatase [Massilia sp. R2A-15]|uniref:ATP-binding protein n=1 Tax=Massilia sp. R2A-15 TaxID=3064278 RepID=UPI002735AA56|nr:SpoIIE family protein phosphatase [Massilia sp. R2A-15]WLI91190.1 SpoIIE family protein phosphatase [Massilia sp. R2A-15]
MEALTTSLRPHHTIAITHASDIAAARRAGQSMADAIGFGDVGAGRLALLISEAATNILKHAVEGRIFLSEARSGAHRGIDVVALDAGPGIGNLALALRDGVSSVGTAGTGLGAMRRLADEFDAYAPRDKGAAFFMRLWNGAPPPAPYPPFTFGALTVPIAGEDQCGDAWGMACSHGALSLMAIDGLGHGADAAVAAHAALTAMAARPNLAPGAQVDNCHLALRATRGAALAVAQLEFGADKLRFAGIGNIAACVIDGTARKQMVSHNGIVGHNMRKVQQFDHACPPGSLIIMHSDGLSTSWDLGQYPGLSVCNPALIAAVLLRDFGRARDDASVLVVRYLGRP